MAEGEGGGVDLDLGGIVADGGWDRTRSLVGVKKMLSRG
jgi:hypothetical protein